MRCSRSARYEGARRALAPDLDHVDRSPDSLLCPELLISQAPLYHNMSAFPKATYPLPLSSTLHDLALLRASEFDFTSILPPQPSLSATTDSAVTDAFSRPSRNPNDETVEARYSDRSKVDGNLARHRGCSTRTR